MFLQRPGCWKQFFSMWEWNKKKNILLLKVKPISHVLSKHGQFFPHFCRAWSVGRLVLHVGTYQLAQHHLLDEGRNREELPQGILCFPTYSGRFCIPSWELTYPTYGRGKSPSSYRRDMFVPWRVSPELLLFCAKNVHNTMWATTSCNSGCNSTHRDYNPSYPFIFGHL